MTLIPPVLPAQKDNPEGFHRRYIVSKADGSDIDPRAVYLVLRIDGDGDDKGHVEACRAAAVAYCDKVESLKLTHLLKFASELREFVCQQATRPLIAEEVPPQGPDEWESVGGPCRKCGAEGHVTCRTSDGDYADEQYHCSACEQSWWIDGSDS